MILLPVAVLFSGALVAYSINRGSKKMSAALERLRQEVAETKGVAASAVAALIAVPQLIRDAVAAAVAQAQGDASSVERDLNSFADDLDAAQAGLAGALHENDVPTGAGTDSSTAPAGGDESVPAGSGDDSVSAPAGDGDAAAGAGNEGAVED